MNVAAVRGRPVEMQQDRASTYRGDLIFRRNPRTPAASPGVRVEISIRRSIVLQRAWRMISCPPGRRPTLVRRVGLSVRRVWLRGRRHRDSRPLELALTPLGEAALTRPR